MLHKFLQNSYQHLYTTRFCSAQTGKREVQLCDFCLLCDFCTDAKLVAPIAAVSGPPCGCCGLALPYAGSPCAPHAEGCGWAGKPAGRLPLKTRKRPRKGSAAKFGLSQNGYGVDF